MKREEMSDLSPFGSKLLNQVRNPAVSNDLESQRMLSTENVENCIPENDIWQYHDDLVKKTAATNNTADGLIFKSQQYLSQPDVFRNEDPLKHWKLLQPSYPCLYNVAIEYSRVVGTSVPCECLFLSAGNIKTEDRNRLTTDHLNKLLFLGSLSADEWDL